MKSITKNILTAVILQIFFTGFVSGKTLVVYHTSDVHGWYNSRETKWDKENSTRTVGGFAALASLINKEKDLTVLFDSGDWYQGTPEGNMTKGMASVILMNALGYSASAIGNHEYDYGEDNLKQLSSSATFSLLAANIYDKTTNKRVKYAKPYKIMEIDDIKIGIIGFITEETATSTMPKYVEGLEFVSKSSVTAVLVPELKEKDIDIIIVLTHSGLCKKCSGNKVKASEIKLSENDIKDGNISIARSAKGDIGIIFGGHNHTGLLNGYIDEESGTLFVESDAYLKYVSRVELEFDDDTGKFLGAETKLIELNTAETGEDEQILALLKPMQESVGEKMDKVIGSVESDLWRHDGSDINLDSPIGNWVTDIMKKAADSQVAFQNTHGIRADIFKGSITVRSVYQAFPFDNTLVTMDITGAQIIELMKQNLHNSSSRIQISGMNVVYSTNEEGNVKDISITIGDEMLNPDAVYKVATNNYLAAGGSRRGEVFKKGRNIKDTLISIREFILSDVEKTSLIKPPECGRIERIK